MENRHTEEIKKLIQLGFIGEALNTLEEWGNSFKNEELKQELILLQSRYSGLMEKIRKGILDDEASSIERNKIVRSILDYCLVIEKLGPAPYTGKGEKGVLAHNIPGEMKKECIHKCIVRIAQEEFVLVKDFSPTAPVKSLTISDEMTVELIDMSDGAFDIKTHSRKNQTVLDGEATEWIFYVKPLLTGTHVLNLKAAMITIGADGREKVKEYTFENNITIETTLETPTEPIVSETWNALSNVFNIFNKKKKKTFLLSGLSPVLAKTIWITSGVLALTIGALLFIRKNEKPIIRPKVDVVLRIPSLRQPFTVLLNGDSFSNWKLGSDSTTIYLPGLEEDAYQVKIEGVNGSCSDSIFPSSRQTAFLLPCKTMADSFTITLLTPFDNFRLFIDDIRISPFNPSSRIGYNQYKTVVRVKAGNHIFRVQDRTNTYTCDEMPFAVDSDKSISLNCTIPVQYYDVEIISPFQRPIVKIDNEVRNAKGPAMEMSLGWKLIFSVKKGTRTFELSDPNNRHNCPPISRNIDSGADRALRFTCRSKIQTTAVIVYVRGENVALWPDLIDVVIDGSVVPRERLSTRVLNDKRKKYLEIQISDVSHGKHKFTVQGAQGVFATPSACPEMEVTISPTNKTLEIPCSFNRLG